MRSWIDGGRRRRRPAARERSRFARGNSTAGGTDLIRFRRNREMFWREATSLGLWAVISIMLLQLARTLWRVASTHLADRPVVLQFALPVVAVAGAVFCIWRMRAAWVELKDIRREQKLLDARLRSLSEDPDSNWTNPPS